MPSPPTASVVGIHNAYFRTPGISGNLNFNRNYPAICIITLTVRHYIGKTSKPRLALVRECLNEVLCLRGFNNFCGGRNFNKPALRHLKYKLSNLR